MIIYLDLDGVIINWVKGICKWFEIPYEPEKVTDWNIMPKLTHMTEKGFWNAIKFSAFWEYLDFYPEAKSFIEHLKQYGKVILLSSPASGCAGYRQNWIENNLPEFFNNGHYVLTPSKWTCADNDSVLIDDHKQNCVDFIAYDGYAIIYPQPWNFERKLPEKDKNIAVEINLSAIKREIIDKEKINND